MSGSAVRADFLPFVEDKKQQNKKEITSMSRSIEKVLLSEETNCSEGKRAGRTDCEGLRGQESADRQRAARFVCIYGRSGSRH